MATLKSNQVYPIQDSPALSNKGKASKDNYIPFLYSDVRDRLCTSLHSVARDPIPLQKALISFSKKLKLRMKIRLAVAYNDIIDDYAYLDPDADTNVPPQVVMKQISDRPQRVESRISTLLEKAAFLPISREDIQAALAAESPDGLKVVPCDPEVIHCQMYFRRSRPALVKYRSWKTWYRQRQVWVTELERVAMLFRLQDNYEAALQKNHHGLMPFLRSCVVGGNDPLSSCAQRMQPHWTYLKMFKEIHQPDIDTIMPGASIAFTWFDLAMIWVPILVGLGLAVYKSAQGTLSFDNLTNIMTSLLLVVVPITWGVRAWFAFKAKEAENACIMQHLLLLHNLGNNAGVIQSLLDEAADQEANEVLLGYYFLWNGEARPKLMPQANLDIMAEAWVRQQLEQEGIIDQVESFRGIDFDVSDAVAKLKNMGIVKEVVDEKGETCLQAVGIEEAISLVDIAQFKEDEVQLEPVWLECFTDYPGVGLTRYFYNKNTGSSTYDVPESFVPAQAPPQFPVMPTSTTFPPHPKPAGPVVASTPPQPLAPQPSMPARVPSHAAMPPPLSTSQTIPAPLPGQQATHPLLPAAQAVPHPLSEQSPSPPPPLSTLPGSPPPPLSTIPGPQSPPLAPLPGGPPPPVATAPSAVIPAPAAALGPPSVPPVPSRPVPAVLPPTTQVASRAPAPALAPMPPPLAPTSTPLPVPLVPAPAAAPLAPQSPPVQSSEPQAPAGSPSDPPAMLASPPRNVRLAPLLEVNPVASAFSKTTLPPLQPR